MYYKQEEVDKYHCIGRVCVKKKKLRVWGKCLFFLKDYKNKDGVLQRYMVRRRKREGVLNLLILSLHVTPPSPPQSTN